VFEQPSSLAVFPSSQFSGVETIPSPQSAPPSFGMQLLTPSITATITNQRIDSKRDDMRRP